MMPKCKYVHNQESKEAGIEIATMHLPAKQEKEQEGWQ